MAYYISPATYNQVGSTIIEIALKVLEIKEPLPVPNIRGDLSRTEQLVRAVLAYAENSADEATEVRDLNSSVGVSKMHGHVAILPTSRKSKARAAMSKAAFAARLNEQWSEQDARRASVRRFDEVLTAINETAAKPAIDQEFEGSFGLNRDDIPVLERHAASLGLVFEVVEWVNPTRARIRIAGPEYA